MDWTLVAVTSITALSTLAGAGLAARAGDRAARRTSQTELARIAADAERQMREHGEAERQHRQARYHEFLARLARLDVADSILLRRDEGERTFRDQLAFAQSLQDDVVQTSLLLSILAPAPVRDACLQLESVLCEAIMDSELRRQHGTQRSFGAVFYEHMSAISESRFELVQSMRNDVAPAVDK